MKLVTVIEEQNIYDIAIQEYGDTRGVSFILKDNSDLLPSVNEELTPGMVLNIDDTKTIERETVKIKLKEESTYIYNVVTEGQTLYDIAVQCYGGLEGIFKLLEDNPDLVESVNDNIEVGSQIVVDESKAINKDILKHFKNSGIRVNSDDVPASGIGFWKIENDNIVS
jgi:hypothetical protein